MSAKDTALLGQILNVQKAILAKMDGLGGKKEGEKSATATTETKSSPVGFLEVVKELRTLNDVNKKQLTVLESINKRLAGGAGLSGQKDSAVPPKGLSETGKALSSMAGGIASMVGSLLLITLVAPATPLIYLGIKAMDAIIGLMVKIYEKVGEDTDYAQGAENLRVMSLGLKDLVKGLAWTALLVPVAPLIAAGVAVIWLTVKALTGVFSQFADAKTVENVEKAAGTLKTMAAGIALLTLSVVASSVAIGMVGLEKVGMTALVLLGFAGVFYVIGKGADEIEAGGKAAGWMGLGMASIGLGVWSLAYGLDKAGKILADGGGAIVGGIAAIGILAISGMVFYVLGENSSRIAAGALATAAIGIGLAVFGLGLNVYLSQIAKVMGVGGEGIAGGVKVTGGVFDTIGGMLAGLGVIGVGALTLALYGTVFALAGQVEFGVPIAIALGAGALALAGAGMVFFGLGLDFYLGIVKKNIGGDDIGQTISVDSFTQEFTTMAGGIGMLLGYGAVFALAGLAAPVIALGAGAIALTGAALVSLGFGIQKFTELVPPGSTVGDDLKNNLAKIRDAFLTFVGEENMAEAGVFGTLKGLVRGGATAGTLAAGIATAMLIGPALSSIAKGIAAWANLSAIPLIKGYDQNGQPIYDESKTADVDSALQNISEYLPKILDPFIEVSKKADLQQNASLLSVVTGVNLGNSPFYRGVKSAAQIGAALSSIAQGVGAWADLGNIPKIIGYNDLGQPIYAEDQTADIQSAVENISKVINVDSPTSVIKPFIDLAPQLGSTSTSLFKLVSGADLGSTPFEVGIRAAGQIGASLSAIGQGIATFANITQIPKIIGYDERGNPIFSQKETGNLETALQNIRKVLSINSPVSVIKPFVDLAPLLKSSDTSLFKLISGADLGETPFETGVRVSGQIGAVLSSVGQGLSVFANINQMPKIVGYDEVGQPIFGKGTIDATQSINNFAGIITNMIAAFGTAVKNIGPYGDADEMEALGPTISGVMNALVQSLDMFSDPSKLKLVKSYKEDGTPVYYTDKFVSIDSVVTNIIGVITKLINAFGDEKLQDALDNIDFDENENIGAFLQTIVEPIKSFADVQSKLPGQNLSTLADRIVYSLTKIAGTSEILSPLNTVFPAIGKSIREFGKNYVASLSEIYNFDKLDSGKYAGEEYQGSTLRGVSGNLGKSISILVAEMTSKNTPETIRQTGDGLASIGKGVSSLKTGYVAALQQLYEFDITNPGFYSSKDGSTLKGVSSNAAESIDYFVQVLGVKNTPQQIDFMVSGSEKIATSLENLEDIPEYMKGLMEFDLSNPGFYSNYRGSALVGVSANAAEAIRSYIQELGVKHTTEQIDFAVSGSSKVAEMAENLENFPEFMLDFLAGNPVQFGKSAEAAFGGMFKLGTINAADPKKRTFLSMFTTEIDKLAKVSTPFEKFTKSFGKMAKDMGVFVTNFKVMDVEGIKAFTSWTDSITILSKANPEAFAKNVITANKAVNVAYRSDPNIVEKIIDLGKDVLGLGENEKRRGIREQNEASAARKEQPKETTPVASEARKGIDYEALGRAVGAAVAGALTTKTLDVNIAAVDRNIKLR
jgi:hypothetical protein